MAILVTGGAGYIGSIVTEQLVTQGHQVVVLDNLSQGHVQAVHPQAAFVQGDLADKDGLDMIFKAYHIQTVMHFASFTLVGESMERPFRYIGDNVENGLNLLRMAVNYRVNRFILSSTANLFDDPLTLPITEEERIIPGSPYGEGKFILERMLHWLDKTKGLKFAALRYFNACGASGRYGEHHDPETHLIPLVLQVALGQRDHIKIFGADYPTPDGTCIRDYVHVLDLAQAHIMALEALDGGSRTYNLGNGRGFSVQEVISAAREVTGHPIPSVISNRRPGDPAVLLSSSEKIRSELGWQPKYTELTGMIDTAWQWYQEHPKGYE